MVPTMFAMSSVDALLFIVSLLFVVGVGCLLEGKIREGASLIASSVTLLGIVAAAVRPA